MDHYDRLGNNVDLANADERYDLDEDEGYTPTLPEDEVGFDPYQEAMEDEWGAQWGDPRRCPHHPTEIISSPDGMFDAPCGACEHAMEHDEEEAVTLRTPPTSGAVSPTADTVPAPPDTDDDIPF